MYEGLKGKLHACIIFNHKLRSATLSGSWVLLQEHKEEF